MPKLPKWENVLEKEIYSSTNPKPKTKRRKPKPHNSTPDQMVANEAKKAIAALRKGVF